MVKNAGTDKIMLAVCLLLMLIGLLMTYSSTMIVAKENYGDSLFFLKRQVVWLILALVVLVSATYFEHPFYLNKAVVRLFLLMSIAGLVAVFFFPPINQSYRWIKIFGLSFQPSEMAKIGLVLYLSQILSRKGFDINNSKTLLLSLLPVLLMIVLILKEPDFGTVLLIVAVSAVMLFVAGLKLRFFVFFFVSFIPVFAVLVKNDPLRFSRILSFLNPEAYISSHGFQAAQSLYAIGSGGLFGQGIGSSTQKLFFLPYAYSDFIFAILAEEAGFLGAIILLSLFITFFFRGLYIAKRTDNGQAYLLVLGLTFLVFIQALTNISVNIGIFPTKGLPLPFISTGGSSLLGVALISGIILNVSRQRKVVLAK